MPTAHYLPNGDEIPFLEGIRENYFEDTPRLAFADWLDEHDDPRGEFMRLQVNQFRTAANGDKTPPEDVRRQMDLWGYYGGAWSGPLWQIDNAAHCVRGLLLVRATPEILNQPHFAEMMNWADSIRVEGDKGGVAALEPILDGGKICSVELNAWNQGECMFRVRFVNWMAKRSKKGRGLPRRLVSLDLGQEVTPEVFNKMLEIHPDHLRQIRYIRAQSFHFPAGYNVPAQETDHAFVFRCELDRMGWDGKLSTCP